MQAQRTCRHAPRGERHARRASLAAPHPPTPREVERGRCRAGNHRHGHAANRRSCRDERWRCRWRVRPAEVPVRPAEVPVRPAEVPIGRAWYGRSRRAGPRRRTEQRVPVEGRHVRCPVDLLLRVQRNRFSHRPDRRLSPRHNKFSHRRHRRLSAPRNGLSHRPHRRLSTRHHKFSHRRHHSPSTRRNGFSRRRHPSRTTRTHRAFERNERSSGWGRDGPRWGAGRPGYDLHPARGLRQRGLTPERTASGRARLRRRAHTSRLTRTPDHQHPVIRAPEHTANGRRKKHAEPLPLPPHPHLRTIPVRPRGERGGNEREFRRPHH